MKIQAKFIFSAFLFFISTVETFCQIDSTSLRVPQLMALQSNQNLVNKAIEGAVYIVRQEYLLETPSGEKLGRGILDHFGKSYRIGVLANGHLWIPTSVRRPWKEDPHFAAQKEDNNPICSHTKIKRINFNEDYRGFKLDNMDTSNSLTSFRPGLTGLKLSDSLPVSGNLILYYLEAGESPDNSVIKSSNIRLKEINWDGHGLAEVEDIQYKDRVILGGVLFTEKINLGRIDIELVGLYTDINKNWVLQAVHPLLHLSN